MKASLAQITWLVSVKFKVAPELLRGGSRRDWRGITGPRQVAMYLARTLGGRSYPEIGRWFNRDHTTAMHAYRRISALRASKPILAANLDELEAALPEVVENRHTAFKKGVERLVAGEVSWRVGPDKLPPARF